MHTIAVVGLKGGVGKTTLSLNIGVTLWRAGKRVLLVDTDPQATLATWDEHARKAENRAPSVVFVAGGDVSKRVASWRESYDHVIIDTPPRLGAETRAAMLASDGLLLPVTPGAADAWASQQTLALVDQARTMRDAFLPAWVTVNRATTTQMTVAVAKMLDDVEAAGRAWVAPSVRNYAAYAEAMARGQGVAQYDPESNAAADVRRLAKIAEVVLS